MSKRGPSNQQNLPRVQYDYQRALRLRDSVRRSLPGHGQSRDQRPQKGPLEQVIVRNPEFEAIVQRYMAVSGMSQTTGEAQNPGQAYGTAVDALIQILGIISRANGNSPLQRSMNRQSAVLASMRHYAADVDPNATVYVGAEPGSLDVMIWGTERETVRQVAVSNGLLFMENEELTLKLRAMHGYLARQKAPTALKPIGICPR